VATKAISSYSFSKREIEESKPRFTPQPNEDRKQPRYLDGCLLQHDQGGYFILKPPKDPKNPTKIREDIPYPIGYALDLTRDDVL
jgi:hypothetical protein